MGKIRVLIAEDDDKVRSLIVLVLCSRFQVVGAVCDGDELLQSAICLLPDVIVSDVFMPRTDGLTVRKKLIVQEKTIPFVFVSSEGKDFIRDVPEEASVAFVYKEEMASKLDIAIEAVRAQKHYRSPFYRD